MGLGDITNADTMGEWAIANKFMTTLNGIVPYTFIRSNHDSVQKYIDRFTSGRTGLVAMLYFSEGGSHVDIEYISTNNGKYFLEENQFSLELDVLLPDPPETEAETENTPEKLTESTPETARDNAQSSNADKSPKSSPVIWIAVAVAVLSAVSVPLLKKKK